ncbi:hypothetical protein HOLleu_34570 [Holothuria leucospilota]|uniref:Uncharacterized protein n=1 Tax=Holothuria leucospilota TaxID=206669 RepID=A0A9Q1BEB0_HOLLE|nr:hypothetical protein HOLleu_34570 [Holothuria leucospilota]
MKRRSERKWLKSGLEIDKQIYCDQSKAYHRMIEQAKCNYHRNEIAKCDEKQLFKLVDRISNPASTPKLPDHDCKKSLANDFSRFFHNKIQMLLNRLTIISLPTVSIDLPESCGSSFTSFHEVSKEEVQKIIMNSATKSCALDPIPTILFKQCLDSLLPVVTSIVNTSLSSGCLPRILKVAHVTPNLKKPKLDRNDLKNYRPISNLKFISKVIERVVSAQLTSYLHSIVPISSEVRNLGVIFDNALDMKEHVRRIVQAASFAIYKIGRLHKFLDSTSAERLVHAFVSSRLDYCNSLLYGLPSNEIDKLQRVQNSAARLVTRRKKYDHIKPVLHELHWLPVRERIIYKIALLTYKALHGMAPSYIADLLSEYKPSRSLRSSSQCFLKRPQSVCTSYYGDRSFSVAAPTVWNNLPHHIRTATSVSSLKTRLKTYLF